MTEREKNNLFYFDSVKCDECGATEDVCKNRYTEQCLCNICINTQLKESEDNNE